MGSVWEVWVSVCKTCSEDLQFTNQKTAKGRAFFDMQVNQKISIQIKKLSSRGGSVLELWTDNSLPSATVWTFVLL